MAPLSRKFRLVGSDLGISGTVLFDKYYELKIDAQELTHSLTVKSLGELQAVIKSNSIQLNADDATKRHLMGRIILAFDFGPDEARRRLLPTFLFTKGVSTSKLDFFELQNSSPDEDIMETGDNQNQLTPPTVVDASTQTGQSFLTELDTLKKELDREKERRQSVVEARQDERLLKGCKFCHFNDAIFMCTHCFNIFSCLRCLNKFSVCPLCQNKAPRFTQRIWY